MAEQSTGWKAISAISTMASATIALLVAFAGISIWMENRFSKEHETTGFRRCAQVKMDVLEHQMIALNSYARYVNAKSNIIYIATQKNVVPKLPDWPQFELPSAPPVPIPKVKDRKPNEEIGRAQTAWYQAIGAKNKGDRLVKEYEEHCRSTIWEK